MLSSNSFLSRAFSSELISLPLPFSSSGQGDHQGPNRGQGRGQPQARMFDLQLQSSGFGSMGGRRQIGPRELHAFGNTSFLKLFMWHL